MKKILFSPLLALGFPVFREGTFTILDPKGRIKSVAYSCGAHFVLGVIIHVTKAEISMGYSMY